MFMPGLDRGKCRCVSDELWICGEYSWKGGKKGLPWMGGAEGAVIAELSFRI